MNSAHPPQPAGAPLTREERFSALFAGLVVQQANMALMFLGQVPHPESGQVVRDLETARMFIDQLEMLEAKTKGNLDAREQQVLKQSLTQLRMSFVDAVNEASPAAASATSAPSAAPASSPAAAQHSSTPPASEEEHRKKFTKKY